MHLKETYPHWQEEADNVSRALKTFRDEELEHLDTAVENNSRKSPFYGGLFNGIKYGCYAAIEIVKKV